MQKTFLTLALVALAALAGCKDETGPMEPGIYSTTTPDGVQYRAVFNKDGTYAGMEDNIPQPTSTGKWYRKDGQLCLHETGEAEALCATEVAVGTDGSFSISANGIVQEFRLVAK